jgi:hypothetical protein
VLVEVDRCVQAEDVADEALDAACRTGGVARSTAQYVAALACWTAGHSARAEVLLRELRDGPETGMLPGYATSTHRLVRCAVAIGDVDLARHFLAAGDASPNAKPAFQHALLTARAVLAHADGEYGTAVELFTEAARRWDGFGSRLEHAHTLLGLAESCLACGQAADGPLRQALELFTSMGAERGLRRCQELLGAPCVDGKPQVG